MDAYQVLRQLDWRTVDPVASASLTRAQWNAMLPESRTRGRDRLLLHEYAGWEQDKDKFLPNVFFEGLHQVGPDVFKVRAGS